MEVKSLKRHMSSIEEGRWVASDEVVGLGDARVKVRGSSTKEARSLFAKKERMVELHNRNANGQLKPEQSRKLFCEMIAEYHLVDVEGFQLEGKPLTVDDVRALVLLPEYEPLATLIISAAERVDQTREIQVEDIKGN